MQSIAVSSFLTDLIKSLRPRQWVKNLFIFSALIFSKNLFSFNLTTNSIYTFIIFSFLSSSVYLFNDVIDIERDKNHPIKKNRPIASGRFPIKVALILSFLMANFSIIGAFGLNIYLGCICSIYLLQSILYCVYFKNIVILDVLVISLGFVLRVIAGGAAIGIRVSIWLLICIIFLSMFLALCKRRSESLMLLDNSDKHRINLKEYPINLLDQMLSVVTTSTIVLYTFYTFSSPNKNLMITIPFVLYGLFRFLYLCHNNFEAGSPTDMVTKDKPLTINIALWLLVVLVVLYS